MPSLRFENSFSPSLPDAARSYAPSTVPIAKFLNFDLDEACAFARLRLAEHPPASNRQRIVRRAASNRNERLAEFAFERTIALAGWRVAPTKRAKTSYVYRPPHAPRA